MRNWVLVAIILMAGCGEAVDDATNGAAEDANASVATTPGADRDDATATDDTDDTDNPPVSQNNATPTQNNQPDTNPDPDPDPDPSGGCATNKSSGTKSIDLEHDGMDREFRIRVPSGYDSEVPTPVVLNFHGRSMTGEQQALLSGMDPVADAEGFIAVYPEGTGSFEQTFNGGWCCGSAQSRGIDDVGFTAAILDKLEADYCIDSARVYAIGMSNGGFMSHRLGCDLADRITAIGGVAGTLGMFDCSPSRPVPVIHFHGTDDSVVPYDGFAGQVSAPGSIDTWRRVNGCDGGSETYFEKGDVTCERWTGCDEGAEVRLCTVEGGGHTWPGGTSSFFGALGKTTDNISATEHSWEFFSQFRR